MTVLEKTVTAEDVVWELDSNEFNVPTGDYKFRATMYDYSRNDNVFLVWESALPVSVVDGYMNKQSALTAAAHIIDCTSYWGRYLEAVKYDTKSNTFDISIGS
tara:strand:- start:716 stop:1024 length:309 start_codon:yes stop_codon:yes gene_type:complete